MSSGRIVRAIVRALDRVLPAERDAPHLGTGRRGEEAAYFYLRERGYVIVARNWRSPRSNGELDLVGWEGDVLCFIEVKTRSSRAVAPAEAAVNLEKQQELGEVAREYLRRMPKSSFLTSRAQRGSPTVEGDLGQGRAPSLPHPVAATAAAPETPARSGCFEKPQSHGVQNSTPQYRFDVVSVYVENSSLPPDITLYRNAFSLIK